MVSAEWYECFASSLGTIITHRILIGHTKLLCPFVRGRVKVTLASIALHFLHHDCINFALERNCVFVADFELEVFLCCHALRWWIEVDVWGGPLIYIDRVLPFYVSQVGDYWLLILNLRSLDDWSNFFVLIGYKSGVRFRRFSPLLSSKERLLQVYLSLILLYIDSAILLPQFLVQMSLLLQEFFFVISQLGITHRNFWRFVWLAFLRREVGLQRRVLRFEPIWWTDSLFIQF